jgi:hypothetical protein
MLTAGGRGLLLERRENFFTLGGMFGQTVFKPVTLKTVVHGPH